MVSLNPCVLPFLCCKCVSRLNEGFTVFLERKIAAKMFGEKERQFQAIGMRYIVCVCLVLHDCNMGTCLYACVVAPCAVYIMISGVNTTCRWLENTTGCSE